MATKLQDIYYIFQFISVVLLLHLGIGCSNVPWLNPIQRGVFFVNRKRGWGHICPTSVFSEIFSEPPLNIFLSRYLFYWLNWVLGHI